MGFRLVCPISWESVVSLLPKEGVPISPAIVYEPTPTIQSGIQLVDRVVNTALPPATSAASVNPMQIAMTASQVLWVVGILILIGYSVVSIVKLKRQLEDAVWDGENIYRSKKLTSPFILGVIRPKIYLPYHLTGDEEIYILEHERTHLGRGDHIIKLFANFTLCLHWFNPLVWLSFALMTKDMEMSCDEAVLKKLGFQVKKDYCNSMLALATKPFMMMATPLAFGEGEVKGRIKNVLNYKKPGLWMIVLCVLAVGCSVVTLGSDPKKATTGENADSKWLEEVYKWRTAYVGDVS